MPVPIQLTKAQHSSWASSPSEISAFLIALTEFIIEIVAPKSLKNGTKPYLDIFSNTSTKIIQHINSQHFEILALSGAYFRNDLILWDKNQENDLNTLLAPYRQSASGALYLDSFKAHGRTANDAHCAFLRSILFSDLEELIQKNKSKEQKDQFDKLLTSALKIIDFLTTPYAVLFEEVNANKQSTSGIDLQWTSMLNAVMASVRSIIASKQDAMVIKTTSKTLNLKETMIDRYLQTFQGCFGIAHTRLQEQAHYTQLQQRYQALEKEYQDISQFIHQLAPGLDKKPGEKTLQDYIHAYGARWQHSYDQLKQQNHKAALEKAQAELEKLRQQLNERNPSALPPKVTQPSPNKQENDAFKHLQFNYDALVKTSQLWQIKANDWDAAQSLMTPRNNPQKMSFGHWINSLLGQITSLTQANQQLKKIIEIMPVPKGYPKGKSPMLRPSSMSLPVTPDNVPPLTTWEDLFSRHLSGTNSTGVKDIISEIKKLQKKPINENEKLSLLSIKMRDIACSRKDSRWSKSHFFGKGRHDGVQILYELMSNPHFSLHNQAACNQLHDLLSSNTFIHRAEGENTPLLIQS